MTNTVNIAELANIDVATAQANDAEKAKRQTQEKVNNKTALCSSIIRKNVVTESAQCDFVLILALANESTVHVAQLVAIAEQCDMLTSCKNKARRISDHVKTNIKKHSLSLTFTDNTIKHANDSSKLFFENVFNSVEYRSQLAKYANKLLALFDARQYDIEQAHEDALTMNSAATEKKATPRKRVTKKAANS